MPLSDEIYMVLVAASAAAKDGLPNTANKLLALAEQMEMHAPEVTQELRINPEFEDTSADLSSFQSSRLPISG